MPPSAEQLSQTLQFSSIETGWTQTSLFPARPQAKELRQFIHHLPWTKPPTTKAATINAPTVTSEYLIKALHQARRNKTEGEIQLMRKASEITGEAHTALMKAIGNGTVTDENAAEAVFVGTCRRLG
jgi:Xaa-Pro dipeptidase